MANLLSPSAKQPFFNSDGSQAANGKLYTYLSGTTTPATTYQDRAGTVPNANPIVLDARGECVIYLTPGLNYRYVLKNSSDVTQWTRDDVIAQAGDADAVFYTAPYTAAVERTSRSKHGERVSVEDFGATGDGTTDDTVAFQRAVAALPSNGGTIYLNPDGRYKLTAMIDYTKPILWRCQRGHSDISTNTTGGDSERPVVFYGGSVAIEALFRQRPSVVGTAIWGGGVDGITFDGFNLCEHGIHLDNARYARLRGKARNMTKAGALISSISGSLTVFSKKVHVEDWEYVYGVSVAAKDSHGIRICGNGSTVPATQHKIDRVFALVKAGAAIKIEETDNCQILSVQAVGDSGSGGGGGAATGCAVHFANTGSTVAYNNHVMYLAGGIKQDNGCFGNIVEHQTSEGGGVTQVSGSSVWHGRLTNYASGSERYRSKEYDLRDTLSIGAGLLHGLSTGFWLSKWVCGVMPEAANSTATAIVPIPWLADGVIESVSIIVGTSTAAAGNYTFLLEASSLAQNADAATPQRSITQTFSAPSQNMFKEMTFTWTELAFTKGHSLLVSVTRTPAAGTDTATTDCYLLGMRIKYRANGPAGTTSLYLPAWGQP